MKILIITPVLPYPPDRSSNQRTLSLIKYLSEKHEITLIALLDSKGLMKHYDVLKRYCKRVELVLMPNRKSLLHRLYYRLLFTINSVTVGTPASVFYANPRIMHRKMIEILEKNDFDIIQVERWHVGPYIRHSKNSLKVLLEHDVEFIRLGRACRQENRIITRIIANIKYKRYQKYELVMCKKFDVILTVTEKDKEVLQSHLNGLKKNIIVTPTGIDTNLYKPDNRISKSKDLVFVGAMDHFPNEDAMLYFCIEILPKILKKVPYTKLYIVGKVPSRKIQQLAHDNQVVVTGYVDNVKNYITKCSVYVVPLRIGSGIKTKIIEAMALGMPVVSTSIGIEGMNLYPGENIIVADDPGEFAEKTIELLENEALRKKLGRNARRLIEEKYSMERAEKRLSEIYEKEIWQNK